MLNWVDRSPMQRTVGECGKLVAGEVALLKKEHTQCHMVGPENIHRGSTLQMEQITFGSIYVYTYASQLQAITVKNLEAMSLKKSGGYIWECLEGEKERGNVIKL